MVDTCNLWLDAEKAGQIDLLNELPRYLDPETVVYQERSNGRKSVIGHVNNYRVAVYEEGVSLNGSLAKSYLSNNVQSLSRHDVPLAFESLSDRLHLTLTKATVRRFDLAHTFIMDHPVKDYLSSLGDCQHYNRLEQPKSILWKNGKRRMTIYDKVAECKTRGVSIPIAYQNKHLLRYELGFVSNLPKQFNNIQVTPDLLSDKSFCKYTFDMWTAGYERIVKFQKLIFSGKMKSPSDFFDQLLLQQFEVMGGGLKVLSLIDEMRTIELFDRPEYYSRAKRRVRELLQQPNLTMPSELITELNGKVAAVKQHYP